MAELKFKGDSSVCSITWLKGFGERTPSGHSKTEYDHNSPVSDTLLGFAKAVKYASTNDVSSAYDTAFDKHAFVVAAVLGTQPLALKFLRELGCTEQGPVDYKKYNHTMSIFTITPADLIAACDRVIFGASAVKTSAVPAK